MKTGVDAIMQPAIVFEGALDMDMCALLLKKNNGTPFWLFLRESKRETDIHLGGTDSQRKTSEFIRLLQDSLETSEAHGKHKEASRSGHGKGTLSGCASVLGHLFFVVLEQAKRKTTHFRIPLILKHSLL